MSFAAYDKQIVDDLGGLFSRDAIAYIWICHNSRSGKFDKSMDYMAKELGWEKTKVFRFINKLKDLGAFHDVQQKAQRKPQQYFLNIRGFGTKSETQTATQTATLISKEVKSNKKDRIFRGWEPSKETIAKLESEGYSRKFQQMEYERFMEYWLGKPDVKRPGWDASFKTWIRKHKI